VLVTAGLHLWRGQALLSILVGTASYVALVSLW
jgi:branched-subunit amino acid transport protein AzlD